MSDPFRQLAGSGRAARPSLPGNNSLLFLEANNPTNTTGSDQETAAMPGVSPDLVKTYLVSHQEVLEDFIMEYVPQQYLESWLQRKQSNSNSSTGINKFPVSCLPIPQEKYMNPDIVAVQTRIEALLESESRDICPLMYEITNVIGCALNADGCSMYVPKELTKELHLYIPGNDKNTYQLRQCRAIGYGTVAAYVAEHLVAVILPQITDASMDERFPRGIGMDDAMTQSLISVPVTLPSKDLICVMEYSRSANNSSFEDQDIQVAVAMAAWVGSVIHQFQVNRTLQTQTELNEFLLGVSKIIFDDMVAMDSLVKRIMTFTKKLVRAERCALFLVDWEHEELYSDLIDEGKEENGKPVFVKKQEIRFSIEKGIAGHVAKTGQVINIPDAYNDNRFNREIDVHTGYTTRSILCMPIISKGHVIGVVQMINKKNGEPFTNADESSFKTFAVFCALALHYSKIYKEVQMRTAQFKVASEQMSYHFICSDEELKDIMENNLDPKDVPPQIENFSFYGPNELQEAKLPQMFMELCFRLCGKDCFDVEKLSRFVITLRKNYRDVAYHNWAHAWNVAHCMYCVLKRVDKYGHFSKLQMKALLIACICHDVDHRGYNNTYYSALGEPLAVLYSQSVMEQHHYAHTVTILKQEGHDLFSDLSKEEYKEVFDVIRHAILSTDLTTFFGNQKELSKLILTGSFNIHNKDHLSFVMALMMTSCDLAGTAKEWFTQLSITDSVYQEFWLQGDEEKVRGLNPIPMMDRDRLADLPKDQVGFINFICIPCYQTLMDIFPETEPLLSGCKDNLLQWQRVVEGKSTTMWHPDMSYSDGNPQKLSTHGVLKHLIDCLPDTPVAAVEDEQKPSEESVASLDICASFNEAPKSDLLSSRRGTVWGAELFTLQGRMQNIKYVDVIEEDEEGYQETDF